MTDLHTAAAIQRMASNEGNSRMATAMTVLSFTVLGLMVVDKLTHMQRERLREIDRQSKERKR